MVVSGIGKSGHIGRKVAATHNLHRHARLLRPPAEASHGDLGMVTRDDVLVAFSNSGETGELLAIVPIVKRIGARLISVTGNPASTLAKLADVHGCRCREGSLPAERPRPPAPPRHWRWATRSRWRCWTRAVSAKRLRPLAPGGALGRKLLTHVRDVMRSGNAVPEVRESTPLAQALMEITRKAWP